LLGAILVGSFVFLWNLNVVFHETKGQFTQISKKLDKLDTIEANFTNLDKNYAVQQKDITQISSDISALRSDTTEMKTTLNNINIQLAKLATEKSR